MLFRVTWNSGIPADGNLTEINCTYRNCLTSVNRYRNGIVMLITVFMDIHLRGNSGVFSGTTITLNGTHCPSLK